MNHTHYIVIFNTSIKIISGSKFMKILNKCYFSWNQLLIENEMIKFVKSNLHLSLSWILIVWILLGKFFENFSWNQMASDEIEFWLPGWIEPLSKCILPIVTYYKTFRALSIKPAFLFAHTSVTSYVQGILWFVVVDCFCDLSEVYLVSFFFLKKNWDLTEKISLTKSDLN